MLALCWLATSALLPRHVAGWRARAFLSGDLETQDALAQAVVRSVLEQKELTFYRTGQSRFDGQSAVAIYQMTLLGLGQIVLDHPEKRQAYLPAMRVAADRLVNPQTLSYAASVYGQHGVTRMDPGEGHAYLGYVNLGLGMLRLIEPETPHAALHDRITEALAQRVFSAPTGMTETYPGETWPPDVTAVVGSIGLHARATGRDRSRELDAWAERFAKCTIHASGYLVQRSRSGTCIPLDAPRGSGTAVGAYFLSFAHRGLSARLAAALAGDGRRTLFGFGGIREYPSGFDGLGDVNAGPIVLGVSVGATGFGLGAARAHRQDELFVELYRTAALFGVPASRGAERPFAIGGALGNALLLAMLTARPV
ncbi:MAG: hypothetical protein AMXMBFR56_29140 [Polyangiaceae bacterium]